MSAPADCVDKAPPSTRNTSDSVAPLGLFGCPFPLPNRLVHLPMPLLSRRLTVARPNCRRLTNYRHGR